MQSTRKLRFDPLSLEAGQEALFCRLVAECASMHGVSYFEPGKIYTADVEFEIAGEHSCLFRRKQATPDQFRIEVIGAVLGEGSFGEVHEIVATLKSQMASRSNANRVVKIFESLKHGEKSYAISQHVSHLRIKKPVFFEREGIITAACVMHCFAGFDLSHVVGRLTDDERLLVARNMLFALKEQVHDVGFVHKDVKIENMMVDDNWNVTMIDYDASHRQSEINKKLAGTLAVVAPEILLGRASTIKCDIFSAGIALAELFGAEDEETNIRSDAEFLVKLKPLFTSNHTINKMHRQDIRALLLKMCANIPANRCTLQEGITVFENCIMNRKQKAIRVLSNKKALQEAHIGAIKSRDILLVSQSSPADKIAMLQKCVEEDLLKLPECPRVLEHYLFMLRVDALTVAKTKNDVLQMIGKLRDLYNINRINFNSLYAQYTQKLSEVEQSQKQVSAPLEAAKQYHLDVRYFVEHKLPVYEKSINGSIALINKLEKRSQAMQYHLDLLPSPLPQLTVLMRA